MQVGITVIFFHLGLTVLTLSFKYFDATRKLL